MVANEGFDKDVLKWVEIVTKILMVLAVYAVLASAIWHFFPSKKLTETLDFLPSVGSIQAFIKPRDGALGLLLQTFPWVSLLFALKIRLGKGFLRSWFILVLSLLSWAVILLGLAWNDASPFGWWPGFSKVQYFVGIFVAGLIVFFNWDDGLLNKKKSILKPYIWKILWAAVSI